MVLGQQVSRELVDLDRIKQGIEDLKSSIHKHLLKKGFGSFVSRHEILGILEEEFLELKEAIRINNTTGYSQYTSELMDIAVGALFGYICMNDNYTVSNHD